MNYIILLLSVALFATVLSFGAYALFRKLALTDTPNERSNHHQVMVTGVGAGFVLAIICFLAVISAPGSLILGATALLGVSIIDDQRGLSAKLRLAVQAAAVLLAVNLFGGAVFQGLLPWWLDMALTAFLWLWLINLTNFMDGIDEMTVTQIGSTTGIMMLLGWFFTAIAHASEMTALLVCVALACFYPLNKHPAKCFMGDAGSVPLGYIWGYILFTLAAAGQWQIAAILPAYYLCDASITLAKRLLRKQPIWQAHSEHFYQQAVRAGHAHSYITRHVLVLNMLLGGLCLLSLLQPAYALYAVGVAYLMALGLCVYFAQMRTVSHAANAPQGMLANEAAL